MFIINTRGFVLGKFLQPWLMFVSKTKVYLSEVFYSRVGYWPYPGKNTLAYH
jgi:hypothetical protein